MLIKDPIQIKIWEVRLGRKLTDDERIGEKPVWYKGRKVYLELTDVVYPYGLMDETVVRSLLKGK